MGRDERAAKDNAAKDNRDGSGTRAAEQVGTVAEETERLLRLLRTPDSSESVHDEPDGVSSGNAQASEATGDQAGHARSDCGWCPICRGVAWVRSADEETMDTLVQGATMVVSALFDLADQARNVGEQTVGDQDIRDEGSS